MFQSCRAVPDQLRSAGGQRRRFEPAGRRHPGRGARVRRPHHHRPVLVQGDRRRRADLVRSRPGTVRAGGRPGGQPRQLRRVAAADKKAGAGVLGLPDQALRIGNAVGLDTRPVRWRCWAPLRRRLRHRRGARVDAGDGDALMHAPSSNAAVRTDWLTDGQLAATRSASRPPLPGGSPPCPPNWPTPWWRTGARRPASCSSTAAAIPTARSSSPQCNPATCGPGAAAPRIRREPGGHLPRPRSAAQPPLPGRVPLAGSPRFGADAVVHTASTATSSGCPARPSGCPRTAASDAALGDLPLIYPFLVNDPGEGTQAKRRAHAVLVDHLIPPMARAETSRRHRPAGTTARRARHHRRAGPGKLPAIRQQIWTLMRAAKMDHDWAWPKNRPEDDVSTTCCCTSTAGSARSRTSRSVTACTFSVPPGREAELDLVLAILRAGQLFGGEQHLPGLAPGARPGRGRQRR